VKQDTKEQNASFNLKEKNINKKDLILQLEDLDKSVLYFDRSINLIA